MTKIASNGKRSESPPRTKQNITCEGMSIDINESILISVYQPTK